MTGPWLHAPQGAAAVIAQTVAARVPVITTERLVLRAPAIGDYPAYAAVFTSDRARYMGGPFSQEEAFADFCQGAAGWLLRGAGMWTVTGKGTGEVLGWLYLWQEFGDPEPELGWVLTEAAEGNGYASEAAKAVLPHALRLFGAGGFVSYVDAGNDRSARVAEGLGERRDRAAEAACDYDCHIYRHFAPEARR